MTFEEEVKALGESERLEDGNYMLLDAVDEDYEDIFVCVSNAEECVMAFDGGSTVAALRMVYNFKNEDFRASLIEICKRYGISLRGNVFFKEAEHGALKEAVDALRSAIREICRI